MPFFISILLTAGVAYWFYQTSEKLGSKSAHWAVAGVLAYQVPAWAWMLLVSKPYLTALRSTAAKTTLTASLIGHSWIVIGLISVLLVYKFLLLRTNVKSAAP